MKDITIGGQAVIEGVMMKSKEGWAVAVRNPEGEIVIKSEKLKKPSMLAKIPLVRGFFILIETLWLGMKAIDFSSKIVFKEEKSSPWSLALSLFLASVIGVILFILLPLYLTKLSGYFISMISTNSFVFNLIDGILRVFVFIGYVLVISMLSMMRRIFAYHGAEHKVINAYEAGETLTAENVEKYSRLHVRCGTSFIFIVLVISILVFSMIPSSWSFVLKALSRVILLPLIAGVSYEILKISARWRNNIVGRVITFPGLIFQKITTREPDIEQIEVACQSLKAVLNLSEKEVKANA
ncbi:uncharacterized conserved protein YqhQ [Thermodesulfovibrio aggregans]|uniref:Uncharacterized conserved protein YqhQ n=1 Tax=Thermodesulfovibrio aggregans TaxID=86166 RepID=A0A0U9HRW2_9BACT|nr:DUF1385 domain-containing protein [Thermodesulfovibrio aggregans]GAQ95774.1 uncharacterized conserved protein YqhQ [Thermodesulfovibrio aggregans]